MFPLLGNLLEVLNKTKAFLRFFQISPMTNRESNSPEVPPAYLSKKVLVNGQPVTLYSKNGITWLSSPEEIEDTMARLDNTRVLLNDVKGEKSDKAAKEEKSDTGGKEQSADEPALAVASQKPTAGARYRMKGPKPRPILRQDGVAITGTPVAPISSSTVQIKVGDTQTAAPTKGAATDKKIQSKREAVKGKGGLESVSKLAKALSKVVPESKNDVRKGVGVAQAKPAKVAKKLEVVKAKLSKPAKKPVSAKGSTKGKASGKGASKASAKGSKKAR